MRRLSSTSHLLATVLALALCACALAPAPSAQARPAWTRDADGWRLVDGSERLTGWQKVDGSWYWLSPQTGLLRRDAWLEDGGAWYLLDRDGAMARGWRVLRGTWYWFDHSGAMASGWRKIDGVWYWFDANGAMVTGTVEVDGVGMRFSAQGAWLGEASVRDAVATHGQLRVSGGRVVDEAGAPFQLRGISTHGLAWFGQYVSQEAFATWHEWGANCVRLALYTQEWGGWCSGGDRAALLATVERGIAAAQAEGLYVIVDWHILSDGSPLTHQDEAIAFFRDLSAAHANDPHLIYEICNEPNGGTDWATIRAYANAVIPVIRQESPRALVVVGTPTWSQDVDAAAAWPLEQENVCYALHFYAATHGSWLRDRASRAADAGCALLISEFGACEASGNGWVNEAEANAWVDWACERGIGMCCWNLSNKDEASSLIASWCTKTSGWTVDELSQEGRWYQGVLQRLG